MASTITISALKHIISFDIDTSEQTSWSKDESDFPRERVFFSKSNVATDPLFVKVIGDDTTMKLDLARGTITVNGAPVPANNEALRQEILALL